MTFHTTSAPVDGVLYSWSFAARAYGSLTCLENWLGENKVESVNAIQNGPLFPT